MKTISSLKAYPEGIFVFLVLATFLLGGGSRADIASLMFLRPVALVIMGLGLIKLSMSNIRPFRLVFMYFLAIVILVLLFVLPLPPLLWKFVPDAELLTLIDRAAGLEGQWRSLSMDPVLSRNALWSLAVPAAALVWGVQISRERWGILVALFVAIGCASALIGLLQLMGPSDGALYPYDVTNKGSAVGLFANRNHHAVFLACLLPCLAAWLTFSKAKKGDKTGSGRRVFVASVIAAFFVLTVLAIGSRAGFLTMLLGLFLGGWIYLPFAFEKGILGSRGNGKEVAKPKVVLKRAFMFLGTALFAAFVWAAIYADRAVSLDRFFERDLEDDTRSQLNQMVWDLTERYFPIGSGVGSFETVFKLHEPDDFLSPFYANHAHNDFLEVAMTTGLLGILLLIVAGLALLRRSVQLVLIKSVPVREAVYAKLGLSVVLLLIIASLVDYPLRVPSLQLFCAMMTIFLFAEIGRSGHREPHVSA